MATTYIKMATTKTDNLEITIQDNITFNSLTSIEKEVVEKLRNSLLEIFPLTNNTIDNNSISLAENFAYKNLDALNRLIDSKIDERLSELE